MTTIPNEISEDFLRRLENNDDFDAHVLSLLRAAIAEGKPLKAESYISIFQAPTVDEIK